MEKLEKNNVNEQYRIIYETITKNIKCMRLDAMVCTIVLREIIKRNVVMYI